MKLKLLAKTPDAKTVKGLKKQYTTFIMYLDPRMKNICKWATPGCKAGCLFSAGRGAMSNVVNARRRKTQWYLDNPKGFKLQIRDELKQIERWSKNTGKAFCIRLNGTSDLDFTSIIRDFPNIQFYDYTKNLNMWHLANIIKNYYVTFSRSETNLDECIMVLENCGNVAVVFEKDLPNEWMNRKVINGDVSDLRFKDPKNVVVGLRAKGRARYQDLGFVVRKQLSMVTA